jgi:hypothetical protein
MTIRGVLVERGASANSMASVARARLRTSGIVTLCLGGRVSSEPDKHVQARRFAMAARWGFWSEHYPPTASKRLHSPAGSSGQSGVVKIATTGTKTREFPVAW